MKWPFGKREYDGEARPYESYFADDEDYQDEEDFLDEGFGKSLSDEKVLGDETSRDDESSKVKECPQCGAKLFADMDVCYGCLYEFGRGSHEGASLPSFEHSSLLASSGKREHEQRVVLPWEELDEVGEQEEPKRIAEERAVTPKAPPEPEKEVVRTTQKPNEGYGAPPAYYCPDPQAPLVMRWNVPPEPDLPPEMAYREIATAMPVPLQEEEPMSRARHFATEKRAKQRADEPQPVKSSSLGLELRTADLMLRCRVPQEGLSVGRDEDNDVVLSSSLVSRHHVRIVPAKEGFLVHDCGATNLATLNGVPVSNETRLNAGGTLDVCGTRITPVLLE